MKDRWPTDIGVAASNVGEHWFEKVLEEVTRNETLIVICVTTQFFLG
jgi:hypothetical protein